MPRPECSRDPSECRIRNISSSSTLAYAPQTYDGNGKPVGGDLNTYFNAYSCSTCGKDWTETTRMDSTAFQEVLKQGSVMLPVSGDPKTQSQLSAILLLNEVRRVEAVAKLINTFTNAQLKAILQAVIMKSTKSTIDIIEAVVNDIKGDRQC